MDVQVGHLVEEELADAAVAQADANRRLAETEYRMPLQCRVSDMNFVAKIDILQNRTQLIEKNPRRFFSLVHEHVIDVGR